MNFIIQFFYIILYKPLFNVLILLYYYIHDFGLAVMILTILIKILTHPLTVQGFKSQKRMAELQPKIKAIQSQYGSDVQKQNQLLMELYRKEGFNPFSGCLPLLVQIPVLIALYQVFLRVLSKESLDYLFYNFVPHIAIVQPSFLWVLNMSNKIFVLALALLAGATQFWQAKISANPAMPNTAKKGQGPEISTLLQKQMLYIFPGLAVLVVWRFGAVIGIYWVTSSLFSILEQIIINRKYGKNNRIRTNKTDY